MSVSTRDSSQPTTTVEQARLAWLTAGRDTEHDRWNDLYDVLYPRPDREAGE